MDDVRIEDGPVERVEIDIDKLLGKPDKVVTDSIDLTLESIFAGEENYNLLPDRQRRYREENDPSSLYTSMRFWGRTLDLKIAFIPLVDGDFTVREITLLDDMFGESFKFLNATQWCYKGLFDEPAPWDEEEQYYAQCGCIRCGKELNFFEEYSIDLCIQCVEAVFIKKFELTNEV